MANNVDPDAPIDESSSWFKRFGMNLLAIRQPGAARALQRRRDAEQDRGRAARASAIIERARRVARNDVVPFDIIESSAMEGLAETYPDDPQQRTLFARQLQQIKAEQAARQAQQMTAEQFEASVPILSQTLGLPEEQVRAMGPDMLTDVLLPAKRAAKGGPVWMVDSEGNVIHAEDAAGFEAAMEAAQGRETGKLLSAYQDNRLATLQLADLASRTAELVLGGAEPLGAMGEGFRIVRSFANQVSDSFETIAGAPSFANLLRSYDTYGMKVTSGLNARLRNIELSLALLRAAAEAKEQKISRDEMNRALDANRAIFSGSRDDTVAGLQELINTQLIRFNRITKDPRFSDKLQSINLEEEAPEAYNTLFIRAADILPEAQVPEIGEEEVERRERGGAKVLRYEDLLRLEQQEQ